MTTLKLRSSTYYAHKTEFVQLYQDLGLRWLDHVTLGKNVVNGWFSEDHVVYLLKLSQDGTMHYFDGNCIALLDFLRSLGATSCQLSEIPHQAREYFIGADLHYAHLQFQRRLAQLSDNWRFTT